MQCFITVNFLKLYSHEFIKFQDIYLMLTVSSSAHSYNLKLTKAPVPIKFGLFTNLGLTQKPKTNKTHQAGHC